MWSGIVTSKPGSLAVYEITVREFLNEVVEDKWVGRGLQRLPVPLRWPPQSPDVVLCRCANMIRQREGLPEAKMNNSFVTKM